MKWRLIPLSVLTSALLLQGCAVTRVGDNLPYGILNNSDLQLVEAGLPSYLLTLDGLIENWPESPTLLASGADLYGAYSGLFVDDPERAQRLSEKSLSYAMRAACAQHPRYCELREMDMREFEAVVAKARKKDVPVLFTLGSSWAGYIQENSNDWNAVAELGRVDALMSRVVELDEGYQHGQAHMYLGVLNSILPAALGGQPERAQAHFEKSIALSEGVNLLAPVLYAERYHRLMFDRDSHDRLLNEVLAADPQVHGMALQNSYAQQQARQLLESADDYF